MERCRVGGWGWPKGLCLLPLLLSLLLSLLSPPPSPLPAMSVYDIVGNNMTRILEGAGVI